MAEQNPWLLRSGQYLGEISALCFLPLPSHVSSFPFLLAGTGSQILLYDVEAGKMLKSFHVFEGIRVHGISCNILKCTGFRLPLKLTFRIAVYGERRVKLFDLHLELALGSQSCLKVCAELNLMHSLPKFRHWVLDVCFFKGDDMSFEQEAGNYLALGLSDNSICVYNNSISNMVLEVRCPERSLLYSMRLWGSNLKTLHVASGTIYNEIIIWKLVPQGYYPSSGSPVKDSNDHSGPLCNDIQFNDQQYEAICLSRLIGHEGSIFRIAWSSDGSKLMSVSDDRSARLWNVSASRKDSDDLREVVHRGSLGLAERENSFDKKQEAVVPDSVGLVLFGHNSRIWDCCISDSLIVTAGEDCTCHVWGMDGSQLKIIKEHTGRGIWRCLYDPNSSLLITAGFDSSIKVHRLHPSLSGGSIEQNGEVEQFKDTAEVFTILTPNMSEVLEPMDSKSEYVRCLHFTREDTMYVATNQGYLHCVKLSDPGDVKWTELVRVGESPVVCMDILSMKPSNLLKDVEDWIAVGDGKGNVTVIRVSDGDCASNACPAFTWSAGIERRLLGTYWCKSLKHRHIFTADPRGILKLWSITYPSKSGCDKSVGKHEVSLIAEFSSCFGTRIMCLDALLDQEVLVCGDQRGNLVVFPLSKGLLLAKTVVSEVKIPSLNYFKGAHGISSVASITLATLNINQVEIRSTGGDGCICYFKYDRDWQNLEFTGMKQVKELSLIQSVFADANTSDNLLCGNYAVGFASAHFIICNLTNEIKVVQVPCGGWRRPHSYYLGDVPELQNCFAFVKGHVIHIHRLWVPIGERKLFPQVLHIQYHGKEIHSLCFVSGGSHLSAKVAKYSWIATGCEDGTVRLTRYSPEIDDWSASKLLGEHVAGSAVRSLCFVSKIHIKTGNQSEVSNGRDGCNSAFDNRDYQFLLISVGAKRVITAWLLCDSGSNNKEEFLDHGAKENSSMLFQWLSTDMPSKFSSTHRRIKNIDEKIGQVKNALNKSSNPTSRSYCAESFDVDRKSCFGDENENDWRYLAVTAFLVKGSDCRLTVCFVVVACSDATLTLRALLLPHRLWFDVALLIPLLSPVLALQHVVVPICAPSRDKGQIGNAYIVIGGSTDGSFTYWDLTGSVEGFMQLISKLQPEKLIDCQKRPRTGRGSQGGRWWRLISNLSSKTDTRSTSGTVDTREGISGHISDSEASGASSKINNMVNSAAACSRSIDTATCLESDMLADNSSSEICEVQAMDVMKHVHQSGVNCLHVSRGRDGQNDQSGSFYYLVSGGDDQSIHCLAFDVAPELMNHVSENENSSDVANHIPELGNMKFSLCGGSNICRIKILYHERIASAHSSAVKGVWTDGIWVFSTGLDQRVRCWHLEEHGKLKECASLIISVPEPETLDARACGRNQYQIVVAGRGMQTIVFSTCHDMEGNLEGEM
ncbi:uncharacterized protein LOC122671907 isoform X2 [Telopea speciosissima]|uniref:uncharacterized protein LOC122671907 isoform X2 n=1 Tax=Telopea speciosissima TaxID=54955 RepID=UPI001CC646AE|nr:uncharacterized protein LOC122671907 isoform X2 [Telopea speciosissima]